MLGSLLDIFFPPVCPLCEEGLIDGVLCGGCHGKFSDKKISGPLCAVCGAPFMTDSHAARIGTASGIGRTCGRCTLGDIPFKEARSAFVYDGEVVSAVQSFKYRGKTILAGPLGGFIAEAARFSVKPDIIVPVPLHGRRLRARGFNQSLLLARQVAKRLALRVDYLNLIRVRPTCPQTGLKTKEREGNVKGAFDVKKEVVFRGKRVLLVDDVFTTGSTIKECARVLKKAGAEVLVATLARTVKA